MNILTPRAAFLMGQRAILPILMGVFPFGLIAGVTAINSGLTPWQAFLMSVVVFAGASQIAALALLTAGTPLLVILLTGFIINLRFLMYSATLAPFFKPWPRGWKLLLAYAITDQSFAVAMTRLPHLPADHHRWFYLGAAATGYTTYQLGNLLGIFLGAFVPASWSLDFAIPLTFMAMLIPRMKTGPLWVAAAVSSIVVIMAVNLPYNANIITAALAGIAAGMAAQAVSKNRTVAQIEGEVQA